MGCMEKSENDDTKRLLVDWMNNRKKKWQKRRKKDGYTPMHGAAYQGRVNIAKILHDHGVPLRVQHSDSHEPIVRACWGKEKRHTDTVEFFLENGVPFFEVFDQCMSSAGNRMTKQLLQKWMENGGVGTKGSNFIEL